MDFQPSERAGTRSSRSPTLPPQATRRLGTSTGEPYRKGKASQEGQKAPQKEEALK